MNTVNPTLTWTVLGVLLSLAPTLPEVDAAIMGPTDSRIELYQIPAKWQPQSQATVMLSHTSTIARVHQKLFTFSGGISLGNSPDFVPMVHPKHRFASQPRLGDCSGVLIAPHIVLTAAHCLDEVQDPLKLQYLAVTAQLGYASETSLQQSPLKIELQKTQTSTVERILYQGAPTVHGKVSATDFAILKLKDPIFISSYPKLKTRYQSKANSPVAIMGHPYGLPLKADLEGRLVRDTSEADSMILAFLDSGNGNSGGPIFDGQTQTLIGLLAAGGPDWGGCEFNSIQQPTAHCEMKRPETVEQIMADPEADKKTIRAFQARYPDGIITAWASRLVKMDAIVEKLRELQLQFEVEP